MLVLVMEYNLNTAFIIWVGRFIVSPNNEVRSNWISATRSGRPSTMSCAEYPNVSSSPPLSTYVSATGAKVTFATRNSEVTTSTVGCPVGTTTFMYPITPLNILGL